MSIRLAMFCVGILMYKAGLGLHVTCMLSSLVVVSVKPSVLSSSFKKIFFIGIYVFLFPGLPII